MNTEKVKVGDRYFGVVCKYYCNFLKGIKIKEFEVVKVNPKSFKIAFDSETRRYPQLMKKGDIPTIDPNKKVLAFNTLKFVRDETNWSEHLKKKIVRYCRRIIKEDESCPKCGATMGTIKGEDGLHFFCRGKDWKERKGHKLVEFILYYE